MTDKLAFLSGPAAGEAEAAPDPRPVPEPVAEDGGLEARAPDDAQPPAQPARDASGRFASSSAPKGASEDETASAPPKPSEASPEAKEGPLSEKEVVGFYKAMQAEREKRQAAEARLKQLEAARPQGEQPPPSQADALQAALFSQTRAISRRFAEAAYGKDQVAELHDWAQARCDADPAFNQLMLSSEDPYEAAKQARDREIIVSKVTPDRLAAFEAWEAQQKSGQDAPGSSPGQARAPGVSSPQPQQAQPPPRSLATAAGTGDAGRPHVPTHEGAAYQSLPFNR